MRAAKIRREEVFFQRIPGVPQKNAGGGLRLRKYSENRPLGTIRSKIPVTSGGSSAYFGKRSGPILGSWQQGSNLSAYFRDSTLTVDG
jgi:hypothetical protein